MKNLFRITPIEAFGLLILISLVGVLFLSQKEALDAIHRDKERKVSINSLYYALEETIKPTLGGYPVSIDPQKFSAIDKQLLIDPDNKAINTTGSTLRYEATGCNGGTVCSGYTLRASLEREADFVKSSY